MTNRIALGLGAGIVFAVALDLWTGAGATLFLARKLADLTDYLAFWH